MVVIPSWVTTVTGIWYAPFEVVFATLITISQLVLPLSSKQLFGVTDIPSGGVKLTCAVLFEFAQKKYTVAVSSAPAFKIKKDWEIFIALPSGRLPASIVLLLEEHEPQLRLQPKNHKNCHQDQ